MGMVPGVAGEKDLKRLILNDKAAPQRPAGIKKAAAGPVEGRCHLYIKERAYRDIFPPVKLDYPGRAQRFKKSSISERGYYEGIIQRHKGSYGGGVKMVIVIMAD
jgi:hypothetical protein